MFEYISGKIEELNPVQAVIDCGGMGYSLMISSETYQEISGKTEARLYCYFQIINQEQTALFGFSSKQERDFFKNLIRVQGIGPKMAIRALSQVSYKDLNQWILNADEKGVSSISGIGKKIASKMILELKDRLIPLGLTGSKPLSRPGGMVQEAEMALESLGFDSGKISAALKELSGLNLSLEDMIRQALVFLNKSSARNTYENRRSEN